MSKTTDPKPSKKQTGETLSLREEQADAKESTLYVNSVEKALQVLSAFGPQRRHLTLTQIAAGSGMDMSAVQRFTHTLVALNLLRKDADTKLYELSPRMLDFAHQYIASNDLASQAMPFMQHLAMEVEATVNLTVLDGVQIVYLQRILSRYVLVPELIVGARLPAYCTSAGLAILAHLPPEEVQDILARSDLVKYTRYTVNEPARILERLESIRELGYAHVEDEMYLGDIALAVAITNPDGRAVGAINVAVARPQWQGDEDRKKFSSLLIAAGRAISSRL